MFFNAFGQNKTKRHHEKLRDIRDEITSVEKKIKASKKKESSILILLNNLDLDIDIAQSLVQNLKKEQKKKKKEITTIEKNLTSSEDELEALKQMLSKRLVYTYKYGRVKDVELLLTARSINDGLLWLEYQKRLSEHAFRNYVKIKEKKQQITRDRDLLTVEIQDQKKVIGEKVSEEKNLKQKKNKRQAVLKKVRKSTDVLRQQLADKEKSAQEIENLIVQLERAPQKKELLVKPNTPFAELKGEMLWPASGEIITKFGRYKHPVLKTVTENIGIEIKAPLGSPVQVVASGVVTTITWQRGRGNIVIVKHYGGFYSVYAHLEEILVNSFDKVQMGDAIGSVGESGSLKGPVLHFEIWSGTDKLNPEAWLGTSS